MLTNAAEPSGPSFGLFLTGEDTRGLDDAFVSGFAELIHRHTFVVIRGASLADERFLALNERLGKPVEYAFGKVLNMEARAGAEESQFTHASMPLHQDAVLNRNSNAVLLLFLCKEAPPGPGGETLVTHNRRFLRVAPSALLDELRRIRIAYRSLAVGYYDGGGGKDAAIEHPAIVRHPRTGEETLYIALDDPEDPRRNYQASVVGYSAQDSRRLMQDVDRVLRSPGVLYQHAWQPGDILALDNYLACHGRNPFQPHQRRRLLRVVTE